VGVLSSKGHQVETVEYKLRLEIFAQFRDDLKQILLATSSTRTSARGLVDIKASIHFENTIKIEELQKRELIRPSSKFKCSVLYR
jgi:hypothetical protein